VIAAKPAPESDGLRKLEPGELDDRVGFITFWFKQWKCQLELGNVKRQAIDFKLEIYLCVIVRMLSDRIWL
jgi:hypothetical protein